MGVPLCPDCGAAIDDLDVPCPECGSSLPVEQTAHRYWETFKNRTTYRYRPDEFVDGLNEWLADQPGLLDLGFQIHLDRQGLVGAITFSCLASAAPSPWHLRLERVRLVEGFLGRRRTDVGTALTAWTEQNPAAVLYRHAVISQAGLPVEVWILAAERAWPAEKRVLAAPDDL